MMQCLVGNTLIDRDRNASINIKNKGPPKAGLDGFANEAMMMYEHRRLSSMKVHSVDTNQLFSSCKKRKN